MASVHFGTLIGPVGFSRPVAIKRLHPQFASDPHVRSMLLDEARLVARIRHPNVVPTVDILSMQGEFLLVMEYVHGESLSKLARAMRAKNEEIPMRVIVAIMTGVLHGLHAAHEAKTELGEPLAIVHRDVSPQNVLVGVDGIARVIDFGVAHAAVRIAATQEGVIKGKLAYMAPEQLGERPLTRAADLYAAAVVLWELVTGRRLFVADGDLSAMFEKILRAPIDRPSRHRPGLSPAIDEVVMRGLQRDPTMRFGSARDMALALERAYDLASPSEVGEWVERAAAEVLAERAQKLSEFERAAARGVSPGEGRHAIEQADTVIRRADRPSPVVAQSGRMPSRPAWDDALMPSDRGEDQEGASAREQPTITSATYPRGTRVGPPSSGTQGDPWGDEPSSRQRGEPSRGDTGGSWRRADALPRVEESTGARRGTRVAQQGETLKLADWALPPTRPREASTPDRDGRRLLVLLVGALVGILIGVALATLVFRVLWVQGGAP
jgi:serine/threonine-protein kinase